MAELFSTRYNFGSLIERISGTAGVSTSTSFKRADKGLALYIPSGDITSKINTGIQPDFTGDRTFISWACHEYRSGVNNRRLVSDAKFELQFNPGFNKIVVKSDGVTSVDSADDAIKLNRWYCVIVTRTSAGVTNIYVNNMLSGVADQDGGIPEAGTTDVIIGNNFAEEGYANGLIGLIKVEDHIFSEKERSDAYKSFLNAAPLITEKTPKYGPWNKPHDTSRYQDEGLVAAYNMIPSSGGVLTDISDNDNNGTIDGCIQNLHGLIFRGNDYINLASSLILGKEQTFAFRTKPNTSSNHVIIGDQDLSNDFIYLINTNSQISYRINGTTYNLGTNTFVNNQTQDIVITRNGVTVECYNNGVDVGGATLGGGDNVNYNNLDVIGIRNGGLFYKGEIYDLRCYSYAFTKVQAKAYHNSFVKPVLVDRFTYDPISSNVPRMWKVVSGTFTTKEDATGKYISCDGNGDINISGIDLSMYAGNGFVKKLTGDLSADEGGTVDAAGSLAFASNTLTATMTSGQKLREIVIESGEDQ